VEEMMFYKETDFKEEPFIGEIPKDWDVAKLGDKSISEIIMGQSPPSSTYNKDGVGLPFLQGKIEFGDIYPKVLVYCSKPIKIAEPNDVLFSVRAPVGDVNLAPYKLCIGRGLAAIRFNNERVSHSFYFYWFQKIKKHLEALGKGSTFKAVNKDDLENLRVPLPPLNEQRGIVGVLGVVDSVIAKTGEVIAKTERLKKGLMQTLLTRGIGHKEYKQTPIGKIPEDWETVKLEELLNLRNGQRPKISETGHFPIFGANGIMGYTDEFLTENDFTLIFGRVGASGEMHLGEGKIWVSDNAIFSQSYNKNRVYPPYLFYLLKFKNLSQFALKTTHPIITKTFLDNFSIQLPRRLEEQKKIASILTAMDEKLQLEHIEKTRLERIKRGLMDLLLTGKIRVKVD
jgi:type I restriction enzyme S subunit